MFTAKARRAQRKEKKIGHGLIQIKEFKDLGIHRRERKGELYYRQKAKEGFHTETPSTQRY